MKISSLATYLTNGISFSAEKKKVAIMASGSGSNAEAISDYFEKRKDVEIEIFSDKTSAGVYDRMRKKGKQVHFLSPESNYEFFSEMPHDLIVLAGYMKMIKSDLVDLMKGKIVNIHPSLLPDYPGTHSIERAYNDKRKETGITIHYVDHGMDTGPVIFQESTEINPEWSLDELEAKIHSLEHHHYPRIIDKIISYQPAFTEHLKEVLK